MSTKKRVLAVHPWMGRGGSEAAAVWSLQALQDTYDLTFVTSSEMHWDELNAAYGTSLDASRINFIKAPHLPLIDGPAKLVYVHRKHFEKTCRKLAPDFDICLSTYNPIDFGRPGIQLIGDFSFSEKMRKKLYVHGDESFQHKESLFRKMYIALGDFIGPPSSELKERGDLVLANSGWTAGQLEEHFSVGDAPVIFPPAILPDAIPGAERDPLGFACLGRIAPEKEIDRIIEILGRVRTKGYPVSLQLIGHIGDDPYGLKIGRLVEENREWVHPHGFLDLEEKQRLLSRQSFALHACRIEAFGIAVAEMASLGCLPFIPATGGAGEIVPFPELQFSKSNEAVDKIEAVLSNPEKGQKLRFQLAEEMGKFGPDVFMSDLRRFVGDFSA